MNRKVFYTLYILVSSIVNIIFTALVIALIFGICFVFLKFVFHAANFEMYANAMFGSFTIGLVLSFFLYSKITTKIIKKYSLDEKFGASPKKSKVSSENVIAARKTVLPDSVKEEEEDEKWRE